MKVLKSEEWERKLTERYDDHPAGWRFLYTVDNKGFYGVIVANNRLGEQYSLKFSSPYSPKAVGAVSTLEENPLFNDPDFSGFGIRWLKVSEDEERIIMRSGSIPSSLVEKIKESTRRKPQPTEGRHGLLSRVPEMVPEEAVLTGPFPMGEVNIEDTSDSQRELNQRMREELDRGYRYYKYVS